MDLQPEIRWHMRPCLVDFLVEVHLTFRLRAETLYLTLNIVDRYVSRRVVYLKHYQLLGCAALWIASKFEDPKDRIPTVEDLAQICRGAYDEAAFIQMEYHVLDTIQWVVGHPTAEAWLRVACCESGLMEDTKTQHVARFLMEITLFYREFVKFVPSAIAAGALILARHTCGKPRRVSHSLSLFISPLYLTSSHEQPFDETDEALQVVELLDARLATNSHDLSEVLVKKYSYSFYSKASTHILQFFLEGRRFVRQPLPNVPPITPLSSHRSSKIDSSSSPTTCVTSNTASSESDDIDMPTTPAVPAHGEAFNITLPNGTGSEDKENWFPTATGNHIQHHPSPSKRSSIVGDDPMGISVANMFPIAPGAVTFGRAKQAPPPTPRAQ